MPKTRDPLRLIIKWLLEGTRGGPMRGRILQVLRERPMNINQLAKTLNINYKTVMHHIEILEEHGLVRKLARGYGAPYTLTATAEDYWELIEEALKNLGLSEG